LKPDLYAVTASGDYEDHWFCEIDRATESMPTLLKKCVQYEAYRRTGAEQDRLGVFPLVVWVVPDDAQADKLGCDQPKPRQRPLPGLHPDHIACTDCWRQCAMTAPRNQVLIGDVLQQLRQLPDGSVDMVLTSPPYFRLRDYQVDGQRGLEDHVEHSVSSLRAVTQQARRLLVRSGGLWLNVADSYSTHTSQGAARLRQAAELLL